jgi:hypothetical protein
VKITTPRHIMFHILKIGTSTSPYIKKKRNERNKLQDNDFSSKKKNYKTMTEEKNNSHSLSTHKLNLILCVMI